MDGISVSSSFSIRNWKVYNVQQFQYTPLYSISFQQLQYTPLDGISVSNSFSRRHWTVQRVQQFQYMPLNTMSCPAVSVYATVRYVLSSSFSIRHWTVCRVQKFQYTPLDAVSCPVRNSSLPMARNVPDTGRRGVATVSLWVWQCKHTCPINIWVHCVQKHVGRQNKTVHLFVVASLWP